MDAKNAIFNKRQELMGEIRYSDSKLRNEYGTSLTAATGRDAANLVDDPGAESGLAGFLEHGGYCDELNIWFLSEVKDTHVRFTKEINEFVVTAQCSRADYEHVLARIRQLNA